MRKIMILKMLFLIALLIVATNLLAQESVPAPLYKDGDVWVFRVVEADKLTQSTRALGGDYQVSYQKGKFVVRLEGGEKTETKQDLGQIRRMLVLPDDERHYLQFPLAVGKTWNTSYTADTRGASGDVNRSGETSVTGIEQLTTAAGTFRVFKIHRYDTGGGGRTSGKNPRQTKHWTFNYYYSPETRSIVKYSFEADEGRTDIELIKYVPAQ